MSTEVVKNVVEMVFNNAAFERNASTSLQTLEKLKNALNFEGAVRGLETIGQSIKNTSMDSLYNGVSKVSENFNAFEVVATRVLQNVTDKVQGLATKLINDVTLQPLKDGFAEYELQMDSVQTIMSSTGQSVGVVNRYLDELNEYADRTIYSFSDMTANIGKFTNAGVDLDRAVSAIQGVSNVAAVSGANTNEASRAMYNFAQALSSGAVKLIDWKSIENANMATVEFKQSLIDTAVAMGTLTKQGDDYVSTTTDANGKISEAFNATKMFNDSLSSQWMTTDVLVQTLQQYSTDVRTLGKEERALYEEQLRGLGYTEEQIKSIEDLGIKAANSAKDVKTFSQLIDTLKESLGSGWTKTWQMIFGDLNEAKVLWTGVNDVLSGFIGRVSDSRNAILETWHKSGYTYNKYGELVKAVYDEQGKLDTELSTEIVENGKMIRDEMGGRDFLIAGLTDTYETFASVMSEFGGAFSKNFLGIDNQYISDISITGEKLISLSRSFYDAAEGWKAAFSHKNEAGEVVDLLDQLRQQFDFFAQSLRTGYDGVIKAFSGISNAANAFFRSEFFNIGTLNELVTMFSSITGRVRDFGEAFNKHFGADKKFENLNGLVKFFNGLQDVLETIAWSKIDIIINMFDALGSVFEHLIAPFGTVAQLMGTIGIKMGKFADALNAMTHNEDVSKFEELFTGLADGINAFIDSIRSSVDFSGFSKFFDNLLVIMTNNNIDLFGTFADAINGLINVAKAFIGIASPFAAAFADVFGDWIVKAAEGLSVAAERFRSFTERLIPNAETMTALQHVFEGAFKVLTAIADLVGDILLGAWDSFGQILGDILPDSDTLVTNLTDLGDRLTDFSKIIETLVDGDGAPKLSEIIGRITDKFIGFFGSIKDIDPLERLGALFQSVGDGIKHALGGTDDMTLLDVLLDKVQGFLQRLRDILSDDSGNLDFVKIFEAGGIGVVIKKLIDFFKELKDNTNNFTGFLSVFNDIKDAFTDLSESLGEKFKTESIKAIATAILEIAGALFIISMIDPRALTMSIAALAGVFDLIDTLLVSLKTFNKSDAAVLAAIAGVIQTLGNSILMMAGAIAIIGGMGISNAVQGLVGIIILMQAMTKVVKELAKVENELPKIATALMGLAIAINLLVIPIKVLGGMDLPSLAKGLGAVGIMLAGLVASATILANGTTGSSLKSAGFGMILMSTSIKILASAVNDVKDLEWEQLAKGLSVMAGGLIGMVSAAAIISKAHLADDMMVTGASLMLLGSAMIMLTSAAQSASGVGWEDLGKLAAILAGGLIALGVASRLIDGKNLLMIGGAIFLVATAISQLAVTMNLAKVIAPIATSLGAAISGIADSMQSFAFGASAKAFLDFLKNVILFLPQLAVGLAEAIIQMVVTLGSGAAQIIGAVVEIGKSILAAIRELIPEVFNTIKEFIEQSIQLIIDETPRVVEIVRMLAEQFWIFLTEQVPRFFEFLGTFFTNLFEFLQTEAPLLIETLRIIFDSILQVVIQEAPVIGEAFLALLNTILGVINTAIPAIAGTLLNLLLTLLGQLAMFIPQIADMALQIVLGFLTAIAQNIGQIVEAGVSIAIGFMDGIASKMPELVDSAFKLIIGFIEGLANAIDQNHDALWDAVGHLITSIVDAILDGVSKVADAAGKWITGSDGNGGVLGAIGGFVGDVFTAGANLVQGFIDGLASMPGQIWNAACGLAQSAWNAITTTLDEHSPSRLTYGGGMNFALGLMNGIVDFSSEVAGAATGMANGLITAFNEGMDSDTSSFTPAISPVFDDSNIQNGMKSYSGDINNTITGTATIDGTIEANNQLKQQMAELAAAGTDYSSIISVMNGLRSDLAYYTEQMSKFQVVMDTGTLVGELSSGMDRSLGRSAALVARGVI